MRRLIIGFEYDKKQEKTIKKFFINTINRFDQKFVLFNNPIFKINKTVGNPCVLFGFDIVWPINIFRTISVIVLVLPFVLGSNNPKMALPGLILCLLTFILISRWSFFFIMQQGLLKTGYKGKITLMSYGEIIKRWLL